MPFEDTSSPRLRAARSDPRVMSRELCTAFWICCALSVVGSRSCSSSITWVGRRRQCRSGGAALRDLADLPLSILALGRPEVATIFPRLWAERVQEIALGGLSRKDQASERLVASSCAGRSTDLLHRCRPASCRASCRRPAAIHCFWKSWCGPSCARRGVGR